MRDSDFPLDIVVFCYKRDYYFAKICIASIRYYYPKIPLYLVKDNLAGDFNTEAVEHFFNVQVLDIGLEKQGWGANKLAFIVNNKFAGRKFLLLDADIVFIGKVLDPIFEVLDQADFIVSPEYNNDGCNSKCRIEK